MQGQSHRIPAAQQRGCRRVFLTDRQPLYGPSPLGYGQITSPHCWVKLSGINVTSILMLPFHSVHEIWVILLVFFHQLGGDLTFTFLKTWKLFLYIPAHFNVFFITYDCLFIITVSPLFVLFMKLNHLKVKLQLGLEVSLTTTNQGPYCRCPFTQMLTVVGGSDVVYTLTCRLFLS